MAFVNGWGYNNGTGIGDTQSWTHGDLSRDGKTDYADFIIMRKALAASGLGGGTNWNRSSASRAACRNRRAWSSRRSAAAFLACRRRR